MFTKRCSPQKKLDSADHFNECIKYNYSAILQYNTSIERNTNRRTNYGREKLKYLKCLKSELMLLIKPKNNQFNYEIFQKILVHGQHKISVVNTVNTINERLCFFFRGIFRLISFCTFCIECV